MDDDHCFQLHLELKLANYVATKSQQEKTLEAKVVEFEQKLKTFVSLAQIFDSWVPSKTQASTSNAERYIFGAFGETIVVVTTCA